MGRGRGAAGASAAEPRPEAVYWDTIGTSGRLEGGRVEMLVPDRKDILGRLPTSVETLTGPISSLAGPAHRVDLVFVGDGYQAAQLGAYATPVNTIVAAFFTREPYREYENYFALHRVDVVSVDAGVDNDPTQGIARDTALNMGFWCGGTERLLCVSVSQAYLYANKAPGVDLVAAIANSTKYGGAGYPSSNLATSSGNNGSAVEIMMHEFGHALGNLADEYDYGSSVPTNTGGEPGRPNISKLTSAEMQAGGTKWAEWLGLNNAAFDGLVSTYEGAGYYEFGLYRPTSNSLMRNLGRPFNLPSAEAVILEIHGFVTPIDASPDPLASYAGTEALFVTPMQPRTHALSIQWSRDGVPIAGATDSTLDLASLGLGGCPATIRVVVRDDTAWVRDEAARTVIMTQTLTFHVIGSGTMPSTYCVAAPNSVGPGAFIGANGSTSIATDELSLIVSGCPPNSFGLYYLGSTPTQQSFGNGFRCLTGSVLRRPVITSNIFGDATFDFDHAGLPGGSSIAPGSTRIFHL